MYLTGPANLLSVVKCQDLKTQMWDFSVYGTNDDAAKHSDSELHDDIKNPNPEKEDKQNPELAAKILKEVLDVYAQPNGGCERSRCVSRMCGLRPASCLSLMWLYTSVQYVTIIKIQQCV